MRVLLDTHMVFWSISSTAQLPKAVAPVINDERIDVFVSVVSAWEIAIKVRSGKWDEAKDLLFHFEDLIDNAGFVLLPISVAQARSAGLFDNLHKDPFDRLLAAQALDLDLTIATVDPVFAGFECKTI